MAITMAKRAKKPDLIDTVTKVKECLSILPGEEDRQRMARLISETIQELELLREGIGRFPDASETHQVSHAIHTLVSFFDTLKDKPLLAELLLPKTAKPGKTRKSAVDVQALQSQLEALPTEKIIEELTKHKKDVLVELSARMNITVNKKLTKDALADRIFKLGFANKRGYDLLSGKQAE
ncbi:hypothetical protein B188_25630 [Candidatus Brocadiaceae bacterium B188]|jgi:hypothetical protein|nr:hypothetical protein [Candidatus Brocadia sapporoensis]OQZ03752.1 MAG: hypothetical protein B6D34_06075 [Candidatus Brocadia sp. UTAMX1]QQR65804.1 MAG: hypothetical protein IPI25_09555 [Candidatus Brocadia sp.]RZV59695.1 MAG: hypothetical protein EX330_00520 [Candidatus Brocadia sp. BROELEC01]TWU50133.1 hypothetical protein B188_25630 [Candidatus Brocadiaceae bacterium B188]